MGNRSPGRAGLPEEECRKACSHRVEVEVEGGTLGGRVFEVEVQVFHCLFIKAAGPARGISLPAEKQSGKRGFSGCPLPGPEGAADPLGARTTPGLGCWGSRPGLPGCLLSQVKVDRPRGAPYQG